MTRPAPVPLAEARDDQRYGGKAAQLATALSHGLPVPDGYALGWEATEEVALDPRWSSAWPGLGAEAWAVRSSAVGEDSGTASFAGAHATVLGLVGAEAVVGAVRRVHGSATEPSALAYRDRRALPGAPRMGVVVQRMVAADVAGVLFTRNPVTGAAERVIEASWGLGEMVVSGLVTPDQFRLDGRGRVLEHVPGEKDCALRLRSDGRVEEVRVPPEQVAAPCLSSTELLGLHRLAAACDAAYGETDHDIEFAIAAGALFLLQRRPITHG